MLRAASAWHAHPRPLPFHTRGVAAANFTVNSLGDTPDANLTDGLCADANGACTLRAAIQQANADAAADTISFRVLGTINLTGPLPDLSTDVTILGLGSDRLTVRRFTGGDYRIFTVGAATVSIANLTISNGLAPSEFTTPFSGGPGLPGGGISNRGTLLLTRCVITGNSSGIGSRGLTNQGPAGNGGGISNEGSLTMNDCTVSSNSAAGRNSNGPGVGGGIYSSGELSMAGCTVSFNSTGGDSGGGANGAGGGIYAGGRTRITNSVVHDNRSGGYGGGVYNAGDATVQGSTISGNSTADRLAGRQFVADGSAGGGIANESVMTLVGCTVSGNRTGGGSAARESGGRGGDGGGGGGVINTGTMVMLDSTVSNNVTGDGADTPLGQVGTAGSGGEGGGVASFGVLTMTNCAVTRNVAGRGGRGDGLTVSHSDGDGGDGGGILNAPERGALKLSNSTVVFNEAGTAGAGGGRDGLGGGVYGGARIRSTIISSNLAHSPASASDVSGPGFVSSGYNYIGIDSGGCCFSDTDRRGSNPFDVRLDPVTLIPFPDSPVIDAGLARDVDDQPVSTDRRGAARPFDDPAVPPRAGGDNSDIGAFERQSADPTPTTPHVDFTVRTFHVTEGCVQTDVTVDRVGPLEGTTVVTYEVTGSTAHQRGDFTYATGLLTFAPGEDVKTIPVLISEDAYAEGPEELTVTLTSVTGGTFGAVNPTKVLIEDDDAADGAANPINDSTTFVGQHYHDFLSRQADDAGLAFWKNQLDACGDGDAACLDRKREDVSAAFFLSIEFQATGYYAIRVNKAAFGDRPGNPRYLPFLGETQEIGRGVVVGRPGYGALLEANKQQYAEEFVARADFQAAHGGQNAGQYVDSLFANTGATPTQAERDAAVTAFGIGDAPGRAAALRSVVEAGSVYNRLYNPAFVLMQYFAYLRRNPDAAPDNSFDGYDFWLSKLDRFTLPGEDARDEQVALSRVRRAEMVRAFLLSAEYRGRFHGDPNRGS